MGGRALLPAAVGLAALVALALRVDLSDLPEVTRFRDDAYYAFSWVRSLLEGRGPVVSEGTATSGVHPLWCLILVVPGAVFGAASVPVVAQVLGLCLHAGTAALLALGPGRGSRGGLIAGLIYLGNPVLIAESQNGQETALACFCVLLLWHLRRRGWCFALAAVATVLTRSDLWFVVLALGVARDGVRPRAVVVPAIAGLPLLAFNFWAAGSWMQDSACAIPWLFRQNFLAEDPDLVAHAERVWWYLRPCLLGGPFAMVSPFWWGIYVFSVLRRWWPCRLRVLPLVATAVAWSLGAQDLLVPLVAAALLVWAPAPGRRPVARDLLALGIGLAVLVAAHEMWRNYPRNYYFAPLGIAGALALVPLARGRWQGWLLPLALLQAFEARGPVTEQRPWQEEMAMTGRVLDQLLDPAELVGCFNGGLVTWYRPDRVVNLDGRVNHDALAALQAGQLQRYLDAAGIRFVVDTEVQFRLRDPWPHASGRYFGPDFRPERDLREVVRFDIHGAGGGIPGTDSFRLYWRVGAGAMPDLAPGFADLGPAPGGGRYLRWSGDPGATLTYGPLGDPAARQTLAEGEGGLVFVVRVPAPADAPRGVFDSGAQQPLLVLAPL